MKSEWERKFLLELDLAIEQCFHLQLPKTMFKKCEQSMCDTLSTPPPFWVSRIIWMAPKHFLFDVTILRDAITACIKQVNFRNLKSNFHFNFKPFWRKFCFEHLKSYFRKPFLKNIQKCISAQDFDWHSWEYVKVYKIFFFSNFLLRCVANCDFKPCFVKWCDNLQWLQLAALYSRT